MVRPVRSVTSSQLSPADVDFRHFGQFASGPRTGPCRGMAANSSALIDVFLKERARVVGLIRRITGSVETAEDIAHDALLRLWDRPVDGDCRSLLFRTAQNLAIDHMRGQKVRSAYADEVTARSQQDTAGIDGPDRSAAAREEIGILERALASLPSRAKRVFLLNRLDGCSYDEIALRLRVSVSTVEKDMIRALRACRRSLDRSSP